MIHKKVFSPILFFILLLFAASCTNSKKEDEGKYKLLIDKADVFQKKKVHLDSAFFYYNKARQYCANKSGDNYNYALLQMATVQQYIGDFYGSEESVTEALANYEGTVYKPYLYNILAVTYDKQGRFDDALQYYKKAYASFGDSTGKTLAQNNIGLMYQKKNQHQKAIQLLKPLLAEHNRKIDIALILGNIGYSQFKLNSPEAYSNLSESLYLTDSLQDNIISIPTKIHLSEFFNQKDKLKSQQYALSALLSAKKIRDPDGQLESLKLLVGSSDGLNAKQYSIDFIKLNDSLNLARNSAKNQFAKIKYDSKKAIENQKKYQRNMWLALGLTLLVSFFAGIIFYYIRKRGREKLKGSIDETENRIAKKIHDELANDVYQAIAFTETQNLENKLNKEVLLGNLANIYTKARDISQTNAEIYTDERYAAFLLDLINSFDGNGINIIIRGYNVIDWDKVNGYSKNTLYRVIQELLVNMKKHSEADLVMLNFQITPKFLELRYSDNGKGINPETFSKKGLQYAENRILVMNGTFTFEKGTAKGVTVTLQIPT